MDASEMRRVLAPSAWMVLEELLLCSSASIDGERVASVSLRTFSRSLGLSKDTAAKAIRQLRDAGLVTVAQRRTDAGTFESDSYAITLPDGVTLAVPAPVSPWNRARVDDCDPLQQTPPTRRVGGVDGDRCCEPVTTPRHHQPPTAAVASTTSSARSSVEL
jgi:DNA-binding transcriptional ArsR family regulator